MIAPICDDRAEAIVAACVMNFGDSAEGICAAHFIGVIPREVFIAATDLLTAGKTVGLDSVAAALSGRIEPAQVSLIADCAPTSAYFADSVASLREAHRRRQIREAGLRIVTAAETGEGIVEAVSGLASIRPATPAAPLVAVPILDIPTADTSRRNEVNLLGNGFLRRGQGGIVNGPTGIGKSVAFTQAAFCWGCGRDFFGIRPEKPLRILIVQAENDDEDLADMRDGILKGLKFSATEQDLIRGNVLTARSFKSGDVWLAEIEPLMVKHHPDILLADPLFAYAGVDIAKDQPGLSAFLREMVQPFIIKHACGIIFAHHTNKPPSGRDKPNWQAGDYAYAGSGHNELANWPRFVIVLRSLGSRTVYELRIGKRSKRAGLSAPNGQSTDRTLIQHAETGICWQTATEQDLARTMESPGSTARAAATEGEDEIIVRAFNACAKRGRADITIVAEHCKFSPRTLRRRFKEADGVTDRRVRSGDDVLTIIDAQVVAVATEIPNDLAA